MSNDQPLEETTAPSDGPDDAKQKKARSPVERTLVWGTIALLLAFGVVEGSSRYGYARTLALLSDAVEADSEGKPLTLERFRNDVLAGIPTTKREDRVMICKWWSLVKRYELAVLLSDDENPVVLVYSTPDPPEPEVVESPADGQIVSGENVPGPDAALGGPTVGRNRGAAGGAGTRRRPPRGLLAVLQDEDVLAELDLDERTRGELAVFVEANSRGGGERGERPSREERADRQRTLEKEIADRIGPERFAVVRRHLFRELGLRALLRNDVASELALTETQRSRLVVLAESTRTKRRELFAAARERDREQVRTEVQRLRKDALAQGIAILDDDQRRKWSELLGDVEPST